MISKIIRILALVLVVLVVSSQVQGSGLLLPKDSDGWTIFSPSSDSRLCYVSSSEGDDDAATHYRPSDPLIGDDPRQPAGKIIPFATFEKALSQVRDGYPDWILLKRGDTFYRPLGWGVRSGRGASEPFLISAYGGDGPSPIIKTGPESALAARNFQFFALSGIDFYAHTRNPDDPEYSGGEGRSGFRFVAGKNESMTGMLFEGCRFRFFTGNSIQKYQGDKVGEMVIRRCVFSDNYSEGSHSQGLYTSHVVGLTLEENIFIHNGWLVHQRDGGNDQAGGQATMFNHNTYFTNATDVVFRGNIFLQPSSSGTKWTANGGFKVKNIIMDDNLFIDGEVGISMGGNTTEPLRFVNITIQNNIITDIGRSQPTGRTLGWGIDAQDWDGGHIKGNILMHQPLSQITNTYGINVMGTSRDIAITHNIIHNVRFADGLNLSDGRGSDISGMVFENNIVHQEKNSGYTIDAAYSPVDKFRFSNNVYFSDREQGSQFRVEGDRMDLAEWQRLSGDNSRFLNTKFPDPERNIEGYQALMGSSGSLEGFVAACRKQGRFNWNDQYTAASVNRWIRDGFSASFPWEVLPAILLLSEPHKKK